MFVNFYNKLIHNKTNRYYLLAIFAAALTRIAYLTQRPFHHDEAIHGWFSLGIYNGAKYTYDPTYHGPLLYHLGAFIMKIFGPLDFALRMYPAICGIALVFTPFLFRRWVGNKVAIISSVLILVSPSILYYSRFFRNDIPVLFFMVLSVYWVYRYVEKENLLYLLYSGFFCGLSYCSKENTYVYGFFFLVYFSYILITHKSEAKRAFRTLPWLVWIGSFAAMTVLFYSNLFQNMSSLLNLFQSITYWFGQHKEARIGGAWWFYLLRIAVYEPYLFFALFSSCFYLYKNSKELRGFFSFWFLTNLFIYSYLQEKVPWLMVHFVFPGIIVTAFMIYDLYKSKNTLIKKSVYILLLLSLVYTVLSSARLNLTTFDTSAEPLTYMESPREFKEIVDTVGRNRVFLQNKVSWPLSWYFSANSVPTQYSDNLQEAPNYPFIIADKEDFKTIKNTEGYKQKVYVLRNWWVMDFKNMDLRKAIRFMLFREEFSPLGEYYITFAWKPDGADKNLIPGGLLKPLDENYKNAQVIQSANTPILFILKIFLYISMAYLIHIPLIARLRGNYHPVIHTLLALVTIPLLFYTGVYLDFYQATVLNVRIYFTFLIFVLSLFTLLDSKSKGWINKNKYILLKSLVLFFCAFVFFSLLSAKLPFITGTEKPFNFAFLKTALYSTTYPFVDPWFTGHTVKYYTLGLLIFSWPGKLLAIAPEYLYNIAKALVFTCFFITVFALLDKKKRGLFWLAPLALVLTIAGNLDGLLQLIKGAGFEGFDFWKSSRIIEGTINEFPFFSFSIGDLHPHFIALPFFTALCAFLTSYKHGRFDYIVVGLINAALVIINPWSAFGLSCLYGLVLIFLKDRKEWGIMLIFSALLYLVWLNVFLQRPEVDFKLNFVGSDMASTPRALFVEYGIFFIAFIALLKRLPAILLLALLSLALIFNKFMLLFLIAVVAYTAYKLYKNKSIHYLFSLSGFLLVIFCELLYIDDAYGPPFERMNTVFKFHYMAWMFFIAGIFPLIIKKTYGIKKHYDKAIIIALSILFLVYPIGTLSKNFLKSGYFTINGFIPLGVEQPEDMAAIRWVNENLPGGQTVLERYGNGYDHGGRFGTYSSMNTILGWINHENLWRKTYDKINERKSDIDDFYSSKSQLLRDSIVKKYSVDYIVFGKYEGEKYKNDNLSGFYKKIYENKTTKIYKTEN